MDQVPPDGRSAREHLMTGPRIKRAHKPQNVRHDLTFRSGTVRIHSVDDTWGAMPLGTAIDKQTPGVILYSCHADEGAQESTLALSAEELDVLLDSLIEARAILTKRHGAKRGKWA